MARSVIPCTRLKKSRLSSNCCLIIRGEPVPEWSALWHCHEQHSDNYEDDSGQNRRGSLTNRSRNVSAERHRRQTDDDAEGDGQPSVRT